jgi:hypothetical protein
MAMRMAVHDHNRHKEKHIMSKSKELPTKGPTVAINIKGIDRPAIDWDTSCKGGDGWEARAVDAVRAKAAKEWNLDIGYVHIEWHPPAAECFIRVAAIAPKGEEPGEAFTVECSQ